MSKGEQTRQVIIERAAQLFSVQGYFGASMNDLIRELHVGKGGIYNHFESKEALALAAFDYSIELVRQRLHTALDGKRQPVERLQAIIGVFRTLADDPPLRGGCPVLNTAIESDDVHPPLRDRARLAMTEWHQLIIRNVVRGVEMGELRPETDPQALATVITATIEGAVMLSKLYGDTVHMRRAVDHLLQHLAMLRVVMSDE